MTDREPTPYPTPEDIYSSHRRGHEEAQRLDKKVKRLHQEEADLETDHGWKMLDETIKAKETTEPGTWERVDAMREATDLYLKGPKSHKETIRQTYGEISQARELAAQAAAEGRQVYQHDKQSYHEQAMKEAAAAGHRIVTGEDGSVGEATSVQEIKPEDAK